MLLCIRCWKKKYLNIYPYLLSQKNACSKISVGKNVRSFDVVGWESCFYDHKSVTYSGELVWVRFFFLLIFPSRCFPRIVLTHPGYVTGVCIYTDEVKEGEEQKWNLLKSYINYFALNVVKFFIVVGVFFLFRIENWIKVIFVSRIELKTLIREHLGSPLKVIFVLASFILLWPNVHELFYMPAGKENFV